eukprot:GHVN01031067.1.p1 GENE.GHVN01031067.1~~GHVN01031067.1.p1  ORF type:complete len:597 (+),score=146.22 GHVN01031067.1:479-2269(+)
MGLTNGLGVLLLVTLLPLVSPQRPIEADEPHPPPPSAAAPVEEVGEVGSGGGPERPDVGQVGDEVIGVVGGEGGGVAHRKLQDDGTPPSHIQQQEGARHGSEQRTGTGSGTGEQGGERRHRHHHHHHGYGEAPKVDRLELMRHSFESPLNFGNNLDEWEMAMASIPAKAMVVLTPAVANRTGQFWNKTPVKTPNWEVTFSFSINGEEGSTLSEGFAFWYVSESYATSFPKNQAEEGEWNLLGYKSSFTGMGVFFSNTDRRNGYNPSISLALNDGSKKLQINRDIPTTDGIYYPTRNRDDPVIFKMGVGPMGVHGQVKCGEGGKWTDVFKVTEVNLPPIGYIGFTGFTGVPTDLGDGGQTAQKSDKMGLIELHLYNLDLSQPGEETEMSKAALGPDGGELGDILKDNSHIHDQKEQSQAIKQLSRLVYKFTSEAAPREHNIIKTLTSLSNSLQKVIQELHAIQGDLRAHLNEAGKGNATKGEHPREKEDGAERQEGVHSELQDIRTLFHRHQKKSEDQLSLIHQSIDNAKLHSPAPNRGSHVNEVELFAKKAERLQAEMSKHSSMSSVLMLGVIVVVAVAALSVWKRLNAIEKSHLY